MEDGLVAQRLEHYPDKIGVVVSNPTEPTRDETIGQWLIRQEEIIEKFGYKLINQKRKELCERCKRRRHDPDIGYRSCVLLPITSDGEDCPYFRKT